MYAWSQRPFWFALKYFFGRNHDFLIEAEQPSVPAAQAKSVLFFADFCK